MLLIDVSYRLFPYMIELTTASQPTIPIHLLETFVQEYYPNIDDSFLQFLFGAFKEGLPRMTSLNVIMIIYLQSAQHCHSKSSRLRRACSSRPRKT